MIVPVWIYHKRGPQREEMVYGLLDEAGDNNLYQAQNSLSPQLDRY